MIGSSAAIWRFWSRAFVLMTLVSIAGCGGGSHLPRPRLPDDDPPTPVAAASKPSATAAPGQAVGGAVNPAAKPNGKPNDPPPSQDDEEEGAGPPQKPVAKPAVAGAADQPLSPELQNRRTAAAQLQKISQALEKYRGQHGKYPDQAIRDKEGQWLLSWRVELLPFLGHAPLHARFKLDEPWNSYDNLRLLRDIPDVFASPERKDDKTCIQFVTGSGTAYEIPDGFSDRRCPDGIINTVFAVETFYELAVPWTQPKDYDLNPLRIQNDWFVHRRDGALALFGGDTSARLIPYNLPDDKLLAILTPAGKERVDAESISRPLTYNIEQDLADLSTKEPMTRQFANVLAAATRNTSPEGEPGATRPIDDEEELGPGGVRAPKIVQLPVPSDDQLKAAGDELRKLYAEELKGAKKNDQRRLLGRKLLDEARSVESDPPGFFAMLRAARDIAAPTGDLDTAMQAVKQMHSRFQIDEFSITMKVLEQASPHLTETSAVQILYDTSMRMIDLALERDDFSGARQAVQLAQGAARRTQSQADLIAANRRDDEVSSAKVGFQRIAPHLLTLIRTEDDPVACAAVGRYTALVKRDWNKGLTLLLKGDDPTLKAMAELESSNPSLPEDQARLGDSWWDFSEKLSSAMEKASARTRAVHWYALAVEKLPPSLAKVRAERRIDEERK